MSTELACETKRLSSSGELRLALLANKLFQLHCVLRIEAENDTDGLDRTGERKLQSNQICSNDTEQYWLYLSPCPSVDAGQLRITIYCQVISAQRTRLRSLILYLLGTNPSATDAREIRATSWYLLLPKEELPELIQTTWTLATKTCTSFRWLAICHVLFANRLQNPVHCDTNR